MVERAYIDFETEGLGEGWPPPRPVGVALLLPDRAPVYLSWGHSGGGNNTSFETAGRVIRDVFAAYTVIMHNASFDMAVAGHYFDAKPIRGFGDTMIQAALCNPYGKRRLKELAAGLLGIQPTEQAQLHDWIRANFRVGKSSPEGYYHAVPGSIVSPYACGDVIRTKALGECFTPRITAAGMDAAYARELAVVPIALAMTRRGVRIDRDGLAAALPGWKRDLEQLADQVRHKLGAPGLNIGSHDQLADALEHAGLVDLRAWKRGPRTKEGKRGARLTGKDELPEVLHDQEALGLILAYRKFKSYLSTFVKPWLASPTERIHVEWKTLGAITGRFSSSPNFQNLPKRNKWDFIPDHIAAMLPKIRQFLVPENDHIFLDRDYSQQEYRKLAHFAGGALLDGYLRNPKFDIHDFLCEQVLALGIKIDRDVAKTLNYAISYGAGAEKLSRKLGCSVREAHRFINAYYKALPDVAQLKNREIARQAARRDRDDPVRTTGGRVYVATNKDDERNALNHLIQGSSADQVKAAMIDLTAAGFVPHLQVHDQLVIEVDVADAPRAMRALREAMEENALTRSLRLPFPTDGKYSAANWSKGGLKPWDDDAPPEIAPARAAETRPNASTQTPIPPAARSITRNGNHPRAESLAPILRWMGGKTKLAPTLRPLWEPYRDRRLIEPFVGGMAVTMALMPERALLNDLNAELINFYVCVRDGRLARCLVELRQERAYFLEQRARFNQLVDAHTSADGPDAAALFFYLNKTAMNGLMRRNPYTGHHNVNVGAPTGFTPDTVDRVIPPPDLAPYREIYSRWDFACGDFELLELAPDDFVYADPPYFKTLDYYNRKPFTWSDQVRLVKWLARHPGPVVASGDGGDQTVYLYREHGFNIVLVPMKRSVNSNGAGRGEVDAMLATRNLAEGFHEAGFVHDPD